MPHPENTPTYDELTQFEMGFYATFDASHHWESEIWSREDSKRLLIEMSNHDPDFHAALTGVDPHSETARHADIQDMLAWAPPLKYKHNPAPISEADEMRLTSDSMARRTALGLDPGLTYAEFEMGFEATLRTAMRGLEYDETRWGYWGRSDDVDLLMETSIVYPEYHRAYTGLDPHNSTEEQRRYDIGARLFKMWMGFGITRKGSPLSPDLSTRMELSGG